jgi:glycosyltransferase involved in cell wall biosynthesis
VRILFLSDNFPPESNAPASRLYEHACYWLSAGHQVTVITGAPNFPDGRVYAGYRNDWHRRERLDGIDVVRVKTYITANAGMFKRTLDYVSFGLAAFIAGLCERRPDVIVATSPQFFCALGGWMLAAVRRLPFVFELRDLWPASIVAVGAMRRGRVVRSLEKLELFLYRRARMIVCVTDAFREDLIARGIPSAKIHVVTNGADLSWCAPRARDPELAREFRLAGKFVAGYLGTHGMAHALDRVVDAAERLREREDIVLFFAGAGAERARIERLVAERGLQNVRMIPRQPKERVAALWSLCDVALIPLKNDPVFATVIPSKLFEAMGNGVPVILAVPPGEATSIVRTTRCGVVISPEAPDAMAAAIADLADSPSNLLDFRQSAARAARLYSRERLANTYLEYLGSIAGRPVPTGERRATLPPWTEHDVTLCAPEIHHQPSAQSGPEGKGDRALRQVADWKSTGSGGNRI